MINIKLSHKKAQAEVITSVLLILIGIIAVVGVGMYIRSFLNTNLQQTDCFKTTGQLNIDLGYSFFNTTSKLVYVTVERGSADFNLTGLIITVGTAQNSKATTIKSGNANTISTKMGYAMLKSDGTIDSVNMAMPGLSEKNGYAINASDFATVDLVAVTPILKDGRTCENKADEKSIKSV
jgi:hypothetical protein